MTPKEEIEANIKAATVLTAELMIESLDTMVTVYKENKQQDLKDITKLSMNQLVRMVKAIKRDMGVTGKSKEVDQRLDETQNIIYALAELDETGRKRVTGLIAQINKKP